MTALQKIIKYLAIALAVFLTVCIVGGILSAIGLFSGSFSQNNVDKDITSYTVSQSINSLNIDINAADLTIKQAEEFLVESNIKNLSVTDNNGTLVIKDKRKFGNYNNAVLTLYVPRDFNFQEVKINVGAGRFSVDALCANNLTLELGAGEVSIERLIAVTKADIDGGAGKITVNGGTLNNLELDMGVGQLNLTSKITGNSELDFGVGESNVVLIGTDADYNMEFDKGIGNITVSGKNMADDAKFGNGQNRIDINGGVGAINITFSQNSDF